MLFVSKLDVALPVCIMASCWACKRWGGHMRCRVRLVHMPPSPMHACLHSWTLSSMRCPSKC
uniref:Secreted protein n=1 Tax=Setaria viridis TaxID=4556 RepID=A0A4U6W7N5_SETVI|nr:hypothetical protein SEVIR_1G049850v2 [Setaria viridis]